MHVVNDVHSFIVYTSDFAKHFLIVSQYFFKVKNVASQRRDVFNHQSTCILATSAVDSQQQRLCQVTTCTEELDVATYILIRYAASNSVIVRVTYFTHQIIVFVLDRRCIDRYLSTEVLEAFGQFRTPQNCQVWFW